MLNLNQEYKNFNGNSIIGYFVGLVGGQMYTATSVKDLIDDKPNINSTRGIIPTILLLLLSKGARIDLPDVNYERREDGSHIIYDITGEVNVTMHFSLKNIKEKTFYVPEGHLYKVNLYYKSSTEELVLFGASVEGPPSPETEKEAESNLESRLVPKVLPT